MAGENKAEAAARLLEELRGQQGPTPVISSPPKMAAEAEPSLSDMENLIEQFAGQTLQASSQAEAAEGREMFRKKADEAEAARVLLKGLGYASGTTYHDPGESTVDPDTGHLMEYSGALGKDVYRMPKKDLPWGDAYSDIDYEVLGGIESTPDGLEIYYTDESGRPDKAVISLIGWPTYSHGEMMGAIKRVLDALSADNQEGGVSPEKIEQYKNMLDPSEALKPENQPGVA